MKLLHAGRKAAADEKPKEQVPPAAEAGWVRELRLRGEGGEEVSESPVEAEDSTSKGHQAPALSDHD